jgi:photosystem II stability/assembly factor-like uncharacterized protein
MKRSWLIITIFFTGVCFCQSLLWQPIPGPYASALYQGSTADSSGNLFVGMEEGGIFRSTDKGKSWSSSYGSGTYIFRMAADQFGNVFASDYGGGVLRTTDGGASWTHQNNGLPAGITPEAYSKLGSSEFIMGTYPPGLFLTTDQGNSWLPIPGLTDSMGRIGAVKVIPSGDILLGSIDSGMYRSSDKGVTWRKIKSYPDTANSAITDIMALRSGRILVASETQGVYKSDDNGAHWRLLLSNEFSDFVSLGTTGNDTIYACSAIYGVYRSTDNGNSWTNLGPYNDAVRSMVCYPNGDVFIFAPALGPLVWRAGSTQWDFMQIPSLVAMTVASQGKYLYVGAYPGGFFYSSDAGQSWNQRTLNQAYDIKFNKAGDVFAAVWGGRVWKSTDHGDSWQYSLTATMGQPDGYSLGIDSSGNVYAGIGADYYGGNGGSVFKSTDNGATWQETNNGLGGGSVLAIYITKRNTILVSDNYHGIYRSTDGGANWVLSSTGLPPSDSFISEVISGDKEGRIFCGTRNNGAYVSTDDGLSWKASNKGIPTTRVTDILPVGFGKLYAATTSGVYISSDNGANWAPYNAGIPNTYVNALTLDAAGYLYAATYGSGIYKSIQSVTGVGGQKQLIPAFFHIAGYPNPFNPVTTIDYTIPSSGFVSITIFNAIGEKISTLVSEELHAGHYKVSWNGSPFSSGVYFCRMEARGFTQTIKLLYLK